MAPSIRGKTISGIIYKLLERAGTQIVGIIVSIILARLLEPEVIGVVSLAEVFILIFNVIASYGFGNSLIQNKNSNDIDFSTGFFSSICLATILYIIIWLASPSIESFYGYQDYRFVAVLRFLGLAVFSNSIKSVLQAVVAKRLCFKYYFISSLIAIIVSGIAGITMAYNGFGIWALATQNVLFEFVYLIVLWVLLKWRPILAFSKSSLLQIWKFGWKLILFGLLNVGYLQLRSLIIAKRHSSEQLAYFNRGFRLAKILPEELGNAIMAVLFPVFALENDTVGVKEKTRKSIKVSFYIVCPLLLGLFSISDNFIVAILTEKWISAAFFLRVFCISYLFYVIQAIESESIKSLGKSGILLLINTFSKGFGILLILYTYKRGVYAISIGFMASLLIESLMYFIASRIYLSYGFLEQISDISSILLMSLIMCTVCLIENELSLSPLFNMLIQIISGGIIYWFASVITKNKTYRYICTLIKAGIQSRAK